MSPPILFLKAVDKRDAHTADMFGTHVETRTRKDGVSQKYHVSAPVAPKHHPIGELYHGTAVPFDRFDIGRAGSGVGYNDQGAGIYMTTAHGMARYFAREAAVNHAFAEKRFANPRDRGVVLNSKLKPDAKMLDLQSGSDDAKAIASLLSGPNYGQVSDAVRKLGYDGIVLDEPRREQIEGWEFEQNARTVVVYNQDAIASVGTPAPEMAKSLFLVRRP